MWSLYAMADERSRQQPEMKLGRCTSPAQSKGKHESSTSAGMWELHKEPAKIKG